MILSGWNLSAILRAKRLMADIGIFGDGYRYGWTYRTGAGLRLVIGKFFLPQRTQRAQRRLACSAESSLCSLCSLW
jgi:hypothetical protein